MGYLRASEITPAADTSACLARSVVATLAAEPGIEAVTVDPTNGKISVATLGRADANRLEQLVKDKIHGAGRPTTCGLFEGQCNCSTCGWPLLASERQNIVIKQQGMSTTFSRATCPTAPTFWRWREWPLPKIAPREIEIHADEDEHINEWKPQLAAAILCGIFSLAGAFTPGPWKIVFYAAAYVAGSIYQIEEIWERLQKLILDVHFLMLFVAAVAAYLNAWGEGATLLFLFSFSGALEHYAMGRTQKEIRSLFRDTPKTAIVLDEQNHEHELAVEKIRAGMKLLIKPGAQFPVDGEVLKGATAADESNLTGEATPVEKKTGEAVFAGTINLWGAVEVTVTKPASESSLQKIIKLIHEAQQRKAPAQLFTDRFSSIYTYVVILLAFAMYFIWWLAFGLAPGRTLIDSHSALYRAGTLLVVSSPCALVLSIPSAVLAAIAFGARHGILFRGGAAVEKLAEVRIVALDKTGTLTTGELRVEKIESIPAGRETEIGCLAYSLEKLSTHPLARAVTLYGKQQKLVPIEMDNFESITGHGLRAQWNGKVCMLGKREWFADGDFWNRISSMPATDSGISEVWIACGDLLGRILLRDDIRPQARTVVDAMHREKLQTVVLTGDRKAAAEHLREQLHLDDVRAELKPEEKVKAIQDLSLHEKVAMVGDGVNDAPSLAAAHIGVAMGARGADAALEQADIVLMHDRLENFLAAFRLSRRARKIIRWNLFISLGTVVVLVSCAMFGKIPLTIGVVGHEGSTVVVVMNSLRLLFGSSKADA